MLSWAAAVGAVWSDTRGDCGFSPDGNQLLCGATTPEWDVQQPPADTEDGHYAAAVQEEADGNADSVPAGMACHCTVLCMLLQL